ncbi:MAG: hypothetical protein ABI345_09760 [Jatrophihabitans sp.]
MTSLRHDADGERQLRRARVASTPAPSTGPVAVTGVAAGLTAAGLTVLGLPVDVVAGFVLLVVAVGAILARRTTASLAAGATLLIARVYLPGERVRLYASEVHSYIDAAIVRIGPVNTTLATSEGLLVVANTRLLRAAPDHPAHRETIKRA